MLDEFINEICSQMTYNKTCNALITLIRKAYLSQRKPTRNWLIGTMLDAYEHFCKMDDSTMLNHANAKLTKMAKVVEMNRLEKVPA